jgi:hypothetical protein
MFKIILLITIVIGITILLNKIILGINERKAKRLEISEKQLMTAILALKSEDSRAVRVALNSAGKEIPAGLREQLEEHYSDLVIEEKYRK